MPNHHTHLTLALFFALSTGAFFGCASSSQEYAGGLSKTVVVPEAEKSPDSLTVIPGPEYQAGWLHRVFFGDHYRDIWTTPVKVPIIDLGTFAGGMTPIEQGGGFQTKSLRFQGKNGQLYAFRSVNKDPKKALPEELRETIAAEVFQDQISSSHPAGALVVDALASAVGVLHPHPILCLLPDDPRLGEFRENFSGILGTLEEYPDNGPDGAPGFAGSTKIVNTVKLFGVLEENSEDKVNSRAFLTARFLDILVGDWDRHIKQWRWARFKENGNDVYSPIPRDRDQAFARLDGTFPRLSIKFVDQFESFDDDFNSIYGQTFSGRFLDRRLLVDLSKPTWDSLAEIVVARWTDAVIDDAVRRLPEPYYQKHGTWLAKSLKSRRGHFKEASNKFYDLLSGYVDIHLSDKREYVEVVRLDDERVEVTAWRRDKESGEAKGNPVYHRMFFRNETNEIRVYLLGGDDKALIKGNVDKSITVRVIGGKGDDDLVDESVVHGVLFGFIPFIPQADHETFFYDGSGNNTFVAGPSCSVNKEKNE